jgi:hypothetical protein
LFTTNSSQVASADVLGRQILVLETESLDQTMTRVHRTVQIHDAARTVSVPSMDEKCELIEARIKAFAGIDVVMLVELDLCSLLF